MTTLEYNDILNFLPYIYIDKVNEYYSSAIKEETGISPKVIKLEYSTLDVQLDIEKRRIILKINACTVWTKANGGESLGEVLLGYNYTTRQWSLLF